MERREVIENKNKQHSKQMNEEAVKKIRQEEEAVREVREEIYNVESVFFEDDEFVTLRDGKRYPIAPCTFRDARLLMNYLKTVNVDAIILNFAPTGDDDLDEQRQNDLMGILKLAFKHHTHVDEEYLEEFVDMEIARNIIEIMIGLNGIKK